MCDPQAWTGATNRGIEANRMQHKSGNGSRSILGVPPATTMLLDVDGTLVDSNDSHAQSWVRAFAEAGMTVAFERVRPLMGMGGDKLLPEIDPALEAGRDPGKTIAKRRGEIFKERFLDAIEPTAGARNLLVRLRQMKVRCVVATSAQSDELHMLLRRAGIADLIDDATTTEDAEKSKPSPDIISAALEKTGAQSGATLMLGDTKFDIEAARKAHVATIALRCGGASEGDLAGAIAIFDDPADLDRRLAADR